MAPKSTTGFLPALYRFTFLWYEPIGCLSGVYLNLFDKDHFLRLFVPGTTRHPDHDILHSYVSGAMLSFSIIQAVLFRYTDDVNVWKIVNWGMIAWEACILHGSYNNLAAQGRLALGSWTRDDWMAVALPVLVGVVRVLYVCGVGLGGMSGKSGKAVKGVPSRMDRERTA
ncbi:hypothetical protein GE09DRAFT_643791 [Coniochaeta sp. 2T2.1]|nr:hypothetical protein GE09DRAFT_643791 [Coniochaeta sp. 2T2.1]